MSIIWATGRDGDGRHSLFTNTISNIKEMDDVTLHPELRVCEFGKTYNYYPSDTPDLDVKSFKEGDPASTHIYLWCEYPDGYNIGKYAMFETAGDLLKFCDTIDKKVVEEVSDDLDTLSSFIDEMKKSKDNTHRGVLESWGKIKEFVNSIGDVKRSYNCYEIQMHDVLWSGDCQLPDECYGCVELNMNAEAIDQNDDTD